MSDVTWEPVDDGWDDDSSVSSSSIGWDGKVISIMQDGETMWHAPPPDIRLCRAVPGPQWSQEPPTEPDEDREPSWQDYAALSLHDLAWLREMAEEYEWAHRADPGVDIERVRMVIGRMVTALHKRKEASGE